MFISHNRKRTSRKVGDKKAAEEVAITIRAKLKLGEFNFEEPRPAPTFKEYAELWLSLPHDWKESTKESYRNNMNNHIYPVFGPTPINRIKRKELKSFFDKLISEGVASNTVALIRSPISGVLPHALDSELIEVNPSVGLKLIKGTTKLDIELLSKEEVGRLLGAAKKI